MSIPIPEKRIEEFEKRAFGMFIHWGLYSQLKQGEWVQSFRRIPKSEYIKLKDTFTARDFCAKDIVRIAKNAGMKYITLTTRHHEGFSLYDTRGLSDFDVMHSPAKRDLVAEFVDECRKEDILPMLYHTTLDWYQESFENDFDSYLEYLRKSVEILCTNYGRIGGLWFDGNWSRPDADWKLDELYGTIRKYQPDAIIVNNTGLGKRGELGHPEIDSVTFEQGKPTASIREGMKKYIASEMCETTNDHWGIAQNDFMYKSTKDLIETLCSCRKCDSNYLLNVGPTPEGSILKIQEAMLEVVGDWLKINGKPIYEGKSCGIKGQGEDFALKTSDGKIYLFIYNLRVHGDINVTANIGGAGPRAFTGLKEDITSVKWLDNGEELEFTQDSKNGLLCINATGYPYGYNYVVRVAELL